MFKYAGLALACMIVLVTLGACSSKKFLHEGEHVLSEVKINSSNKQIKPNSMRGFVRQQPNSKWFNLFKVPLGFYCMSKADSVKGNKGVSKLLKKMGEAPVVYSKEIGRAHV